MTLPSSTKVAKGGAELLEKEKVMRLVTPPGASHVKGPGSEDDDDPLDVEAAAATAAGGGASGDGDSFHIVEAEIASHVQDVIDERDALREQMKEIQVAAVVVSPDDEERKEEDHHHPSRRHQYFMLAGALLAAAVIGIVLGTVLPGTGTDPSEEGGIVVTPENNVTCPIDIPITEIGAGRPTDGRRFDDFKDVFETYYGDAYFSGDDDVTAGPGMYRYRTLYWLAVEDGAAMDPLEDDFVLLNQRYVLALLYFIGCGTSWTDHGNWLLPAQVCRWDHINCDDGLLHVDEIDLSFNENYVGTLPTEIGTLTNLTRFASTSIPTLTGTFPTEFGELTKLTDLSIGGTGFTGPLPTEIGRLTDLKFFACTDASFSGVLPSEMGQLTDIDEMFIGLNNFVGEIPSELSNLMVLERFHLHDNAFTGDLSPLVCSNGTDLLRAPLLDVGADCLMDLECGCCSWCCNLTICCEGDVCSPRT